MRVNLLTTAVVLVSEFGGDGDDGGDQDGPKTPYIRPTTIERKREGGRDRNIFSATST